MSKRCLEDRLLAYRLKNADMLLVIIAVGPQARDQSEFTPYSAPVPSVTEYHWHTTMVNYLESVYPNT
jgi:hypothetical protein